jgi:hypothetical protein
MVWVFKTSVTTRAQVEHVMPFLDQHVLPHGRWNFDLEDCDRILRIEHHNLDITPVLAILREAGITCEELED